MLKRKTPLTAKSGIGGGKQKQIDPEYAAWKRERLAHHSHTPTKADRAEFPAKVIKELKEEAGGLCQVCLANPDTTTHHVQPSGRTTAPGRGVKSNGLRCCWPCHDRIQTSETELKRWIEIYRQRYGEYFYFDEQDWEQHESKQAKINAEEQAKKQRMSELEPIVELLSSAAGRKLNTKEVRLLDNLDEREMAVFAKLMADIVKQGPQESFAYGEHFDD
jgi:hypothetical protein